MCPSRSTPDPPARHRRPAGRRRAGHWVGLTLLVAGLVVFVASNLGARAGFSVLPFDPHHAIGQFGGLAVAIFGGTLTGRRN